MLQLRIAIHLPDLKLPLKKALPIAAQLGAEAVVLDGRGEVNPRDMSGTAIRHVRKLLEDHNLKLAAIEYATRRGYNVQDDLDRRVQATKEAMTMAYNLGANAVTNFIGRIPADQESRQRKLLVETLSDIGRHGQRCGARLAATTGAESGDTLSELLAELPEQSVGIDFDPGGLIIHQHSASEAIHRLGSQVLHTQARDAVQDIGRGRGMETQFGRGSVDFAELLSVLEEHDYQGYLTVRRSTDENVVQQIADAVRYINSMG